MSLAHRVHLLELRWEAYKIIAPLYRSCGQAAVRAGIITAEELKAFNEFPQKFQEEITKLQEDHEPHQTTESLG